MAESLALSAALEREHEEIDAGLEQMQAGIEQGEVLVEPFARAAAALRRHIYLEEEFLFQPLRGGGLVAPVLVMVREHGEIWRALDAIEAQLAETAAPNDVNEAVAVLLGLLGEHNVKEERILYPVIDQVVVGENAEQMRERLENVVLPTGWTCEALRA
jgi:iron-sulfur cluster repair protein YtfE (RIC family)